MGRRKFSREFKVEAVKLIRERAVSVAQAGHDLDVHENVLRKWVKEFASFLCRYRCTGVIRQPKLLLKRNGLSTLGGLC